MVESLLALIGGKQLVSEAAMNIYVAEHEKPLGSPLLATRPPHPRH